MPNITIPEALKRFNSFDLLEAGREIIESQKGEDAIIDKNQQMLLLGYNKKFQRLTPYRSVAYAIKKNRQNPAPGYGNPDLHRTGAWYAGMVVVASKTEYSVVSNNAKHAQLITKYGEDITGNDDASKEKISIEVMQPEMVKKIREKTGFK